MPTEKGTKQVADLKAVFESSPLIIAAQYRGLKMGQLNGLRAALKPSKSRFRIVKNTLAGIAADQSGRAVIREVLGGPVGVITSQGDPVEVAKALTVYLQTSRIELKISGGVLGSQVLTAARIDDLSKVPPKEVLVARLLGQMNAPATGLVTVLNGPVRALALALQRIAEEKAKAQPAAAPASA
jgi:large subunit ribosomal protein L10